MWIAFIIICGDFGNGTDRRSFYRAEYIKALYVIGPSSTWRRQLGKGWKVFCQHVLRPSSSGQIETPLCCYSMWNKTWNYKLETWNVKEDPIPCEIKPEIKLETVLKLFQPHLHKIEHVLFYSFCFKFQSMVGVLVFTWQIVYAWYVCQQTWKMAWEPPTSFQVSSFRFHVSVKWFFYFTFQVLAFKF